MEDVKDLDVNISIDDILSDLEQIKKRLVGIYDDMVLEKACEDMIDNIDVMEKRGG